MSEEIAMKVVFLEEVEGTARTGDVKNVADGFARNYLLPRRLAAPATDHYITIAQAKAGKEAKRQERLDEDAEKHLLPKVDGKSLSIEVRVGEQGKLFGSVSGRDIAEALQAATGVELEHRQIDLREPIREIGSQDVTVKLTRNVHAAVTVNVEPIGGKPVAKEARAAESQVDHTPETEAIKESEVTAEAEAEEVAEEAAIEETEAEPTEVTTETDSEKG